jgi:opacity protein-like surface antigen
MRNDSMVLSDTAEPVATSGSGIMKKIVTIAAMAVALMSAPALAKTHNEHRQSQVSAQSEEQFEAGEPYQNYMRQHDGNNFQDQWNDGN